MKTFIGIDYHKNYSYGTVINAEGMILKEGKFANSESALNRFLDGYGGKECEAVLEACRNWYFMHDLLKEKSCEVVLAHPTKVKAIASAKIKTDKIDSGILAFLLRADLIPTAHVRPLHVRQLRDVLGWRMFLVKIQTMTKNRINDLIDRHPQLRSQNGNASLFCKSSVEWLKKAELPGDERKILDEEMKFLESLQKQIKTADKWIEESAEKDERIELLTSIPGIGRFFAMLILCEIDDIRRFPSPAKLCAYAGLVPSTYSSGGKTFHGRIIKTGNSRLRWAMVEAVWPAIRSDASLKEYYAKRSSRKGTNSAKVATARRLLTIVFRVLSENRKYEIR